LPEYNHSQIVSKEGGLLLKDNFEGGATWAYEVGSQSMVCPIIVEDLNPPRQMLVEVVTDIFFKKKKKISEPLVVKALIHFVFNILHSSHRCFVKNGVSF
jgi:hypothetical protein